LLNKDHTDDVDVTRALRAAASYLPRKLLREISANHRAPPRQREVLRGPVMFVDLARFTPFVLSFCAAGQKGIETLQGILSGYFGKLVEGIYAYGGDVYHFAGDAMLVGFTGKAGESDSESASRAVACATSLRSALASYENLDVLGQHHSMQLKFGISFGDYHYLLLGHEDFWYTPLLLGGPIQSAIDAEHHAEGGDILVNQDIWNNLPNPKVGHPVNGFVKLQSSRNYPDGSVLLEPFPADNRELLENCARFMEPVLFRMATTSHSEYWGDYREVTCLFVRFTDVPVTGDVSVALTRLNEIYRFVQESAKAYGAILNRVELGDKGFVFFFMLGAPTGLENKCTLAGRLALKLLNPPFPYRISAQIGAATGYGYCGDIGAPQRKDYTITGEVVNLASRLMTYAEAGGIYLDTTTRDRFDERLVTTEIPNVELKGIPDRITICRLHSEATRHQSALIHFSEQMIGRGDELSFLLDLHRQSREGATKVCTVVGAPGSGKSRLMSAFLKELPDSGVGSYVGVCYSYEQFTAYSTWKGLLREFFGIAHDDSPVLACRKISEMIRDLEGVSKEWSSVIAQTMAIPADEAALTRDLDPSQKTRRVYQIIQQLFEQRAASQPLVFCFDDVHWIDDASLRLIEYLSQRLSNAAVLIVLLTRNEEPLPALERLPNIQKLMLEPLSSEGSRTLLRAKLALPQSDRELEDRILEKAEGNPYYIESIVRNLHEQGVLTTVDAGKTRLRSDVTQIQLPETLQDLVLARIDQLNEDQKTVLRIASVIGRVFAYELLKVLLPSSLKLSSLGDILTRLEALDLVPVAGNTPLTYYFKHAVIRDVAYETLPLERREALHKSIAMHLESSAADTANEHADLLAYHFVAGNELEKGFTYTIGAARQAADKFANQDAVYHFTRALTILARSEYSDRSEDRQVVREQQARVYRRAGMYAEAIDLLTECLERPASPVRRADFHIGLGHVYQEEGLAVQAIEELETALRLLGRRVPRTERAVVLAILWQLADRGIRLALRLPEKRALGERRDRYQKQFEVMILLGKIYFFSNLKKLAWTVVTLVKLADRLDTPAELSLAYSNYAAAMMGQGFVERGSKYCDRSLEFAAQTDNPMILGQVYLRTGSYGIYSNDPLKSNSHFEKGLQIFKQIGGMWEQLTGLGAMAAAYTMASDFDKTDTLFSEVEELADELNSKLHLAWAKCWRPFYRYLLGREDAERAKHEVRKSIPFSIESNDTGTQILAHGHLCAIAVRQGDAASAAWLADETMSALRLHRANLPIRTPQIAWVYAAEAALFALEQGANEVSSKRLHAIVKHGMRYAIKLGRRYPYVLGPGLRVQACYRAFTSGAKRSRSLFEQAIKTLDDGPDRWQVGIACYEAAKIFPDKADEYAEKARAIFESRGILVELRRVEQFLADRSSQAGRLEAIAPTEG
jgi:class 3 adenylate cyclase/tetratricopeptide (TPR) repeat protein